MGYKTKSFSISVSAIWMMTLDVVVNFFSLTVYFFSQAPPSDAKVDQSTGLFDGSSDMFRMSMITLVGILSVAICIGLAYHYVIFLPQRKKGKGESLCLCKKKTLMKTTLHLLLTLKRNVTTVTTLNDT